MDKAMESRRIVIALGGNSLGNSAEEEIKAVQSAVPFLLELAKMGHQIVVTHGNGPQVGMFQNALRIAHGAATRFPEINLADSVAITEGYIGYHLQQGLQNEIIREGLPWKTATVLTRVEVDPKDPAFGNPDKPIGAFFTPKQVMEMVKQNPTMHFMEDSGRGCRRAVASPVPKKIVDIDAIMTMINAGYITVACGGAGIPVVQNPDGTYKSMPCVLDKDYSSEMLAIACEADLLILLTGVEHVCLNFGKPDQKELTHVTVKEALKYLDEGQFGAGSMEPKMRAAVRFVQSKPGREAIIGKLDKAPEAVRGDSGTRIMG